MCPNGGIILDAHNGLPGPSDVSPSQSGHEGLASLVRMWSHELYPPSRSGWERDAVYMRLTAKGHRSPAALMSRMIHLPRGGGV